MIVRIKRAALRASLRLPRRVRRRIAGPVPVNDRGVSLDEQVHWMLFLERRLGARIARGDVAVARAGMRESTKVVQGTARSLRSVTDVLVADVPCRRYVPVDASGARLLYLHGGGWTVGDLNTHDRLCQRIAADAGLEVISVDYALAPEQSYPAGLEDVRAVYRVLREQLGPLAMGGDSAGANLTSAACLAIRQEGGSLPDLQFLIYPAVDMPRTFASHRLFAEGYLLEAESIDWYIAQYAAADPEDPLVSPWYADDASGLPPAIVVTAGFDPLRDEGEAWAARLRESGVDVTEQRAVDQVHGFANMDGVIRGADEALTKLVEALAVWVRGSTES